MARQPIGYWVKQLDRLIEGSFTELMLDQGLTRRHWQVLNVINDNAEATQAAVDMALVPFLAVEAAGANCDVAGTATANGVVAGIATARGVVAGTAGTAGVVTDLRARGWVTGTPVLALTEEGRAAFGTLHVAVSANRSRIAEGITLEQYQATVDTLTRMCANLGGA